MNPDEIKVNAVTTQGLAANEEPSNDLKPTAEPNPNTADPKIRICRKFKKSGTCSYGDKCIFKHVTPNAPPPPPSGNIKLDPADETKPEKLNCAGSTRMASVCTETIVVGAMVCQVSSPLHQTQELHAE